MGSMCCNTTGVSPGPHLSESGVQLEYLAFPFHLSHADLAGELCGSQAVPLQGESAVQGLLAATPNVIEWDLLREAVVSAAGEASCLPFWRMVQWVEG
jgi:hypothetical protein